LHNNGDIWAGIQGGIYKAEDNGETWINKSLGLVLSLQFMSIGISLSGRMLAGCNQDFFRSDNYGKWWVSL